MTTQQPLSSDKTYNIGLLTNSSTIRERMYKGLIETLTTQAEFSFYLNMYNLDVDASGNSQQKACMQDIFTAPYNLLVSLGTKPTTLLYQASLHYRKNIPIVFAGARDPVGLGIAASLESSGNNFTGASFESSYDFSLQVQLFTMLKKGTKRILIVYDPTQLFGYTVEMKNEIKRHFEIHHIDVRTLEISHPNQIEAGVTPHLSEIDAIVTLRDATTLSGIETLIALCNKHNKTLMTSDHGSVDKGAVMGFGWHDFELGQEAANKVRLILEQGKSPADIPITNLQSPCKLKVNSQALTHQNVPIEPALFYLLKNIKLKIE